MSVAECEMWNEWCDRHGQVMWSGGLKCSGCCEEEEEDTWEDVYGTSTIRKDDTMAEKNTIMIGATYYQTYGGGPSGGWVVKDGVVYAANKKGMCHDWEYVAKPGCRLEFIDGTSTSYKKVRLATIE